MTQFASLEQFWFVLNSCTNGARLCPRAGSVKADKGCRRKRRRKKRREENSPFWN